MFLCGETRSILLWDETYNESSYFNEFDPLHHEKYKEIKTLPKQQTSCESDVKWSFRYTDVNLPSSHALADIYKHNTELKTQLAFNTLI